MANGFEWLINAVSYEQRTVEFFLGADSLDMECVQ